MNNRLTCIQYLISLTVFLMMAPISNAQITITAQDLLNQIGSTQTVVEDERFSIPVNLGSPGDNQVWDFRATTNQDSLFAVTEMLHPQQTTVADQFPDANLVHRITSPDEPGFEIFNFFNATSSFFINLGDSSNLTFPVDTSLVTFQQDTLAPLPITFGSEWITAERDTTGFFPQFANISIDTTFNTVDGFGTVRLPIGDFECLRLRQDVKVINQTIVNGMVFSTNVETYIQYNWVNGDIFELARAQSQNGETNPNFTDAQGFGRLDALTPVSVEDQPGMITGFELFQNYPNPFNPETLIKYRLDKNSQVMLEIFNLRGQRVRTLVDGLQPTGSHEVSWDGRDFSGARLSSGMYVYRLRAGALTQTRKMLLLL